MTKAYSRIVWENFPSVATPLNETNLNKMDKAIDEIDNRIISLDTTKADQSALLGALNNVTYNEQTGVFVFTWNNGNTLTADLNIEKIPINFAMSPEGVITMTNADGTTYTCDVSSLIKTYTFSNGNGITWGITTDKDGNKTITASINDGSIAESKLQVNFLANCRAAQAAAEGAKDASELSSLLSEGYAVGTQNGMDVGPDSEFYHNNAKYYSDKAGGSSLVGLADTDIQNPANNELLQYNGTKWINSNEVPQQVANLMPNLIPYPYYQESVESSGITFYTDVRGYVWGYGTTDATQYPYIWLAHPENPAFVAKPGITYTFTAESDSEYGFGIIFFSTDGEVKPVNVTFKRSDGMVQTAILSDLSLYNDSTLYNWVSFSVEEEVDICVQARFVPGGHEIDACIKPMIIEGGIAPTEYKRYSNPYELPTDGIPMYDLSQDVQDGIADAQANLIPFPYEYPSTSLYGVTFTVNPDGTISVSGTATRQVSFNLCVLSPLKLDAGNYIIRELSDDENCELTLKGTNGYSYSSANYSVEMTTHSSDVYEVSITIASGATVDTVLRPMLVKGTAVPTEFKSYANPIVVLSQAQYDALENKDPRTLYFTTE